MKKFRNFTPHPITLNSGEVFPPSGVVARVGVKFSDFDKNEIAKQSFGEVENLPEPQEDVFFIVSAMVLSASDRKDLVAPATGHPDTKRNEKGHIISVPGFVQ